MSHFIDSVVSLAPVHKRRGRDRFIREWDQWTKRLFRNGLIDIDDRYRLRRDLVDAYWASRR